MNYIFKKNSANEWYLIPEDLVEEFETLQQESSELIYSDQAYDRGIIQKHFEEKFDYYRVDSPSNFIIHEWSDGLR